MRFVFFLVAVLTFGFFFSPKTASAYQEAAVKEGGTVTGVVTLEGPIPSPRTFRLENDPFGDFCERISDGKGNIILHEYNVDSERRLQDAIIAVREVPAGKPFTEDSTELSAMDCMFHPASMAHAEMYERDREGHVRHIHPLATVFQNNQPLHVRNHDPIFHNGQVFQKETGHVLLNFPLPPKNHNPFGGLLRFERKGTWVQMVCGMHPYMQTFGIVVNNPYYARTGRDGRFTIDQIPPGKYELLAWHPHFKPMTRAIEVLPNGQVTEDFVFHTKEVRPRVFETSEGLRNY